jgi:hypothetical protein
MPARSHLTFANGILMERYMITAIAFLALTRVGQTSNRKLYDVADELIRQGVRHFRRSRPVGSASRIT